MIIPSNRVTQSPELLVGSVELRNQSQEGGIEAKVFDFVTRANKCAACTNASCLKRPSARCQRACFAGQSGARHGR